VFGSLLTRGFFFAFRTKGWGKNLSQAQRPLSKNYENFPNGADFDGIKANIQPLSEEEEARPCMRDGAFGNMNMDLVDIRLRRSPAASLGDPRGQAGVEKSKRLRITLQT
jgi:hypothetical protein